MAAPGGPRNGDSPVARGRAADAPVERKGWGSVARHGAAALRRTEDWEAAPRRSAPPAAAVPPATRPRYAVRGGGVPADRLAKKGTRDKAPLARAVAPEVPAPRRARRRREFASDVATEIRQLVPAKEAARLELRLADASRAYERDRYLDALGILKELSRLAPGVATVRELHGLTLYRLGRWKEALREMRAFVELTGSVDQLPVVADCERALGHHDRVAELYAELRRAGAGSDVLAEGRLVMAGSLADRGRLDDAISLLLPAATREVRKPQARHLRQWYALADLYERSGDLPRARELFRKVTQADPELTDALERLTALA